MPLKLEDFAGTDQEPQAALIIDLDEWLARRGVPGPDACMALSMVIGMLAARHNLPKGDVLNSARMTIAAGWLMEVIGK